MPRTFVVREELTKGLRSDWRDSKNSNRLILCYNLKPTPGGLAGLETIVSPFGHIDPWPFPQLFRGAAETLLSGKNRVWLCDESNWSLELLADVPPGGSWHFADFHHSWLLFNGSCVASRLPDRVNVNIDFVPSTGCYHNGRAILAGFDPSKVTRTLGDETAQRLGIEALLNEPGPNWVWWSSIGGGDVILKFIQGDPGIDIEFAERNESGYMPMPWRGMNLCVEPLGKAVIVYGEDGIAALMQYADPVPTYGLVPLLPFGVASRGAVGSSPQMHVFVDTRGEVRTISSDLKVSNLGYQDFIGALELEDIQISYDPAMDEFYITDGDTGFLLTQSGMSQEGRCPSSLIRVGELIGTPNAPDDGAFLITVETFDILQRCIKQVYSLELGSANLENIEGSIQYRYDGVSGFQESEWIPLTEEGFCFPMVSGVELQAQFRGRLLPQAKIEQIIVQYDVVDKRNIRAGYWQHSAEGAVMR